MEVKTLESLCLKITDGAHHSPKEFQGGIPMFSVKDMTDHGFDKSSVKTISKEDYKKLKGSGCEPKDNDVLIAKDGSVMKHVFRYKHYEDCALLSSIAILRPNMEIIDPDYLVYSILNPKVKGNIINNYVSGSGVPRIVLKDFKKIEIKVPEIRIQKASSKILNQINSKIELNNKMNQTHEEIAKTLFKSWFIDFDPVTAKAEGRPTGLSKEISDLFPDSFEDSELGEIPKGWEVKALDEIAEFLNGLALQKYPEDEECPRYPVLKIAQLRAGSTKSQDVFSSNIPDEFIVRNGDYIFSWSGSLLAKFWLGGDAALNQHLFKVTSENYPKWFFAGWVEKHLDMFSSIASSKATTMGHIKRGDLKDAKTVVPSIEVISSFGEYFSPIREKANLYFLENNNLTDLRDALLPKLISGELKIPDAENLVEEAGI